MSCLLPYLRQRKLVIGLYLLFFAVLVLVYRLYGLPWGPAIYVCLLCGVFSVIAAVLDFYYYRKRLVQLQQLIRQADLHIGDMPVPGGAVEETYQNIIHALEHRCQKIERTSRKQREEADQYYTLWNHQIKTPIAAIRLLSQEGELKKQDLEQELLKIEQYVSMGLQYQRLEKPSDLMFREYDLGELIRQVLKKIAPLFIHKKIGVSLGEIHTKVLTDEKWLSFIIEQILTNAVKYTPSGNVEIFVKPDDPYTLLIRDTGIGIHPEDLPRIFEWGYTGYNGRLNQRSTGIGLALCRQAAELLGHRIMISSEVGKGTAVMIVLSRDALEVE